LLVVQASGSVSETERALLTVIIRFGSDREDEGGEGEDDGWETHNGGDGVFGGVFRWVLCGWMICGGKSGVKWWWGRIGGGEKDLCKILTLYAQGNLDQGLGGAFWWFYHGQIWGLTMVRRGVKIPTF